MIITPQQPLDPQLQQQFAATSHMASALWEFCRDFQLLTEINKLTITGDVSDPQRMSAEYSAMHQCAAAFKECGDQIEGNGYIFKTFEERLTAAVTHLLNAPIDQMVEICRQVAEVQPQYQGNYQNMLALQSLQQRCKIIMAPFITPVNLPQH